MNDMDIKKRIAENSSLVESQLEKYLDQSAERFGVVYDAMRYSVLGGGKRIRPFLVLEFCRMYGGSDDTALPFACALELIHCYSLIHDDLPCMDDDEYRRGKLTCHKKYGEANALLAGDALLTYAFEVASSNGYADASQIVEAVKMLSVCAGADGMVGGQVLDLIGETEKFDRDTLTDMNRRKTGRLIRCACVLGCIAAGMKDYSAALKYADGVGLAFQVIDDILDEGTEDNKTTYLTFMDHDEAKQYAAELSASASEAVESEVLRDFADYLVNRNI